MNYFTAPGALAPPSTLELLRRTFQIYLISICPIILVSLVTIPPAQILIYIAHRYIEDHPQYDPDDVSYLFLFAVAITWVGMFFRSFASTAISQIAVNAHAETRSKLHDVLRASRGRVCRVFLAICLCLLFAAAGLCFLVVPGIYLTLCWMLAVPAIVIERRGVVRGMKRSWDLTSGERCRLLLVWLYFFLASVAFLVLVGLALAPVASDRYLLQLFAYLFSVATVLPLQNILQTVLYFDVRARRELYDVNRLLRELQTNGGGDVNEPAATKAATDDEEERQGSTPDLTDFDPSKPAWANAEIV